jgi:hypothetical protein
MRLSQAMSFPELFGRGIGRKSSVKSPESSFSIPDMLNFMHRERDFTLKGLWRKMEQNKLEAIVAVNRVKREECLRFGPELNAAAFTLKMGGAARLHGSSKWLRLEKQKKLSDLLPQERTQNLRVEGLDLTGTVLHMEGFDNFEECADLQTLILRDCLFVDDWCVRKLAHSFAHSLVSLNIDDCPKISEDGLVALGYLKKLRHLSMRNLSTAQKKEFLAILLEENAPSGNLEIQSDVDHLSEIALKKVEAGLQKELADLESMMTTQNETTETKTKNGIEKC